MYRIIKQFHFSAAHQLDHLPAGHQCSRLHGHNYVVEVELQAMRLDSSGFVMDYGELSDFKFFIDSTLDHRNLNDVVGIGIRTTAENLARYLYDRFNSIYLGKLSYGGQGPTLVAVRVKETDKTCAEYRA
jgi:6-pyruvoyltetrahydropterin/6-carboxytetrahydropterin synthase